METAELKEVKIKSIRKIGEGRVINLTVKKNHTFVTENGIPTHNCDHLSPQAQAALRNLIEASYNSARFILTANYPKKIIPALHSRVQSFTIEPPSTDELYARIVSIMAMEGFDAFDDEELKKVMGILKSTKITDIRKIIQLLQQSYILDPKTGEYAFDLELLKSLLNSSEQSEVFTDYLKLFKKGDIKGIRNFVYNNFSDTDASDFWHLMIEDIIQNPDDYEKLGMGIDNTIYHLNEGQKNHEVVANKLLNVIGFSIAALDTGA